MPDVVNVGGYAGQALSADAVSSPDADPLAGYEGEGSGVTSTETRVDDEVDLESLTKAELYELAQEADIEGRSSMDRDELIDALQG